MKTNRDKNEQFLDKHADELDELLREAVAVTSTSIDARPAPAGGSSPARDSAAAAPAGAAAAASSETPKASPAYAGIAFSTYDVSSSATAAAAVDLSTATATNDSSCGTSVSLAQAAGGPSLRSIRLKPIGEGAGGSTKPIKKAQKAERQWYKENITVPQQQADAAARAREQRAQEEAERAAQSELDRQPPRPLDPTRFWLLRGMRGSLAPDARSLHTVAAFDDRLYVFGGAASSSSSAASDDFFVCDCLGSVHGVRWSPVVVDASSAGKPAARAQHSMSLIKQRADTDAALFLFGGVTQGGELLGDAWSFSLGEGRWQQHSSPVAAPTPRCAHSSTVLRNYVFVFGGRSVRKSDPKSSKVCADLWVFDTLQERWLKMDAPASAKASSTAAADEKDPAGNPSSSWPCARYSHAACSDPAGERLFVHGGIDAKGRTLADLWLMDYATRQWREVEGMTTVGAPRARHGLVGLSPWHVMLFGGVGVLDSAAVTASTSFSSAPAIVVWVGEENEHDDDAAAGNAERTPVKRIAGSRNNKRFIVETLQQQGLLGDDAPHPSFHSFGGCAVSNGAAFLFSGITSSTAPAQKGSIGRFALPQVRVRSYLSGNNNNNNSNSSSLLVYDPKAVFSMWASRRWNRRTSPVPHNAELNLSSASDDSANSSSSSSSSSSNPNNSIWCHASILAIRAPELWKGITHCHSETRSAGTGAAQHTITRYDLVGSRRKAGLLASVSPDAAASLAGLLTPETISELVSFVYRGVFSDAESRRVATDAAAAALFANVARAFEMHALSRYVSNLSGNDANLATRRAAAEKVGVASAIDDTFSAISGFANAADARGDLKLIIRDSHTNGVETVQVHSAVVACASSVIRSVLSGSASSSTEAITVERDVNKISHTVATTVQGLRMPLGTALAAAVEHMYTGKAEGVNVGNAFEVSLAATKLDLPFLRAAAERVVIDSLSPVLELPPQQMCASLRLAAKYECGRVVEVLINAVAMSIHELDAALFDELPLDARAEVVRAARELFPSGSREIDVFEKAVAAATASAGGNSANAGPTIAKSANTYEDRAAAAHLQIS